MLAAVGQFLDPVGDEQIKLFDVDDVVVVIIGLAFESFDHRSMGA